MERPPGFNPWSGSEDLPAFGPKEQHIKQKQYCNKCNKNLKTIAVVKWGDYMILMSVDIDIYFCLNVLIKSQETFAFSKTILKVFGFKKVFTKMWHQISYYCINPHYFWLTELWNISERLFTLQAYFFFLIPFGISALICAALNSETWVRKTAGAAGGSASCSGLLPSGLLPSFLPSTHSGNYLKVFFFLGMMISAVDLYEYRLL